MATGTPHSVTHCAMMFSWVGERPVPVASADLRERRLERATAHAEDR